MSKMNLDGRYDPRNRRALALVRARKAPAGHRLHRNDWEELQQHALKISSDHGSDAELISYHKRRKRSRWRIGQTILECVFKLGFLSVVILI